MKRQLEIIPIQEFENIEKDSMLYVLGGSSNPSGTDGIICSPVHCGTFSCNCYPQSHVTCPKYEPEPVCTKLA